MMQTMNDAREWHYETFHPLECVKEQTPEICLAAVRHDGMTLKYVREQTYEICLTAVGQNNCAFDYVSDTYKKRLRDRFCNVASSLRDGSKMHAR